MKIALILLFFIPSLVFATTKTFQYVEPNAASINSISAPVTGAMAIETDNGNYFYYSGSVWILFGTNGPILTYTPTITPTPSNTPTMTPTPQFNSAAFAINTPVGVTTPTYLTSMCAVTLTAGTWQVSGMSELHLATGGSAVTINNLVLQWSAADGVNTPSGPAAVTVKENSLLGLSAPMTFSEKDALLTTTYPNVTLAISTPVTLYLVPYLIPGCVLSYEKVNTAINARFISTSTQ